MLFSSYGGVCLVLAFMIFAWGTGYKLSLYKVESAPCSAPAKVCTRGSDAARIAVDHAAGDPAPAQAPSLAAVLISLDSFAEPYAIHRLQDEVVDDLSPLSRAPILYLRPPPDQANALD
jgi:hypothetical protein